MMTWLVNNKWSGSVNYDHTLKINRSRYPCATRLSVRYIDTSDCCPNAPADDLGKANNLDWPAMALRCCDSTDKFQFHGPTIPVGPTGLQVALIFIFFESMGIVLLRNFMSSIRLQKSWLRDGRSGVRKHRPKLSWQGIREVLEKPTRSCIEGVVDTVREVYTEAASCGLLVFSNVYMC